VTHPERRSSFCPKTRARCSESLPSYTMRRCQNTRGGNNAESRECASGASRGTKRDTVTIREAKPSNFSNRVFKRYGNNRGDKPTEANYIGSLAAENGAGAASAMGKGERSRAETKADDLSRRAKENCSGAKGKVGEDTGCEQEGCLEPMEPAAASMRQAFRFPHREISRETTPRNCCSSRIES
jgi:hypothetical protein